jgi:L-malate glycosyltransferase
MTSNRAIKVLHCLETIGPGGVEQRRLSMARYLNAEHYQQALTCSKVIGDFDKRLLENKVAVTQLGVMGSPFNFSYYKKLFAAVRTFRPTIIHGAVFEGVISAVVAGILCRVPIIVIEETSDPANRSWRGHFLFRCLAIFAHAVVATSPAVYHYITAVAKVPVRKVHLLLNGVEPPIVSSEGDINNLKKSLGISSTDFVIGSVGRMVDDHKLFSVLIKSFNLFHKSYPQAKLLLIGDGRDKDTLIQLTNHLELTKAVIFAGHQQNVNLFYSVMNVFALVPAREGFGMAAVEAMFFKLPVVATRVGGLQEIVVENETGILVNPHDEEGIIDAFNRVYCNAMMAKTMGDAGYARAMKKYTAKRYVNDVDILYSSLLTNGYTKL